MDAGELWYTLVKGGNVMKKQPFFILLVISLVLNLLLGTALVLLIPRVGPAVSPDISGTAPTVSAQAPDTVPPETTAAAEAIQSESAPTEPPATLPAATEAPEKSASPLYTRQQLEQLDNTLILYGPGTAKNGDPAPYAPAAQEKYGKYAGRFLESAEGVIYLTFDCGYEYFSDGQPLTGLILDTLKEKDVKAVFFVTMSYARDNPALVRRIIDEGHILGNHSAGHHSMPSLSIDAMEKEIMDLHHYIEQNFSCKMHLVRPPSGKFSIRSLAVTQNLGYETVHWSFAYGDWDTAAQPDPREALDKILSCHHDGAIYLLHAVSATNTQILGDVIDGLRDMGYSLELLN